MADSLNDLLDGLVHRADLDALVRHVDDTCSSRDWDHLVRIRDRARVAVDTGRQLWPIATLANYRMALWAPAETAVRAFEDTARTFMPGPVSEIISVHHTWRELSPLLAPGHDRSLVAYERALRGEDVDDGEPALLDTPIALQHWEPRYSPAGYSDDGVDFPAPHLPPAGPTPLDGDGEPVDDPETVGAFRLLIEPWTSQSNGVARCTVSEGSIDDALHAHGVDGCRTTGIDHRSALEQLAWAGASGGAHGKRRGLATGRSNAWWFLAVFTGMDEQWPCDPDEFGEVISGLRFAWWETPGDTDGWRLQLAVEDADEGVSCVLFAHDTV